MHIFYQKYAVSEKEKYQVFFLKKSLPSMLTWSLHYWNQAITFIIPQAFN